MDYDPQLFILRNCIRALPQPARHECETARYKLYASLEADDIAGARRWSEALRISLLAAQGNQPTKIEAELHKAALDALGMITKGIGK